jgi:outer membrane protein TolC
LPSQVADSRADRTGELLAAFQSVADTLVAIEDDAKEIGQTQRSADALKQVQEEVEGRYASGAVPLYAVLGARSQYQNADVTYVEARGATHRQRSIARCDGKPDLRESAFSY